MTFKQLTVIALRNLAMLSMMLWMGGFTFYAGFVLHTLEDIYGEPEAGFVTQRISDIINICGVVAIALWWALIAAEGRWFRTNGLRFWSRTRLVSLAASTGLLVFLIALNPSLDEHLASKGVGGGFYALHQTYLIASVAHWAVNLAATVATVAGWTVERPAAVDG